MRGQIMKEKDHKRIMKKLCLIRGFCVNLSYRFYDRSSTYYVGLLSNRIMRVNASSVCVLSREFSDFVFYFATARIGNSTFANKIEPVTIDDLQNFIPIKMRKLLLRFENADDMKKQMLHLLENETCDWKSKTVFGVS